jgi:hypothetical protein
MDLSLSGRPSAGRRAFSFPSFLDGDLNGSNAIEPALSGFGRSQARLSFLIRKGERVPVRSTVGALFVKVEARTGITAIPPRLANAPHRPQQGVCSALVTSCL